MTRLLRITLALLMLALVTGCAAAVGHGLQFGNALGTGAALSGIQL